MKTRTKMLNWIVAEIVSILVLIDPFPINRKRHEKD